MSVNNVIPDDLLPDWMKQAKRDIDWGALLIIAFSVIAGWSFITQPEIPATNNAEAYVFRSADYAEALEQGILYTRWSPHALGGYGAPIPHYYPNGAGFLGGVITYLFTNNAITAVRIVFLLAMVVAGSTTYAFVAQRMGALSGLTSALLYLYSPFVMQTVTHIDGDLPLAIGVALLATLVWSVNRLIDKNHAVDVVLVAVVTALTIFTIPMVLVQSLLIVLILLGLKVQKTRDLRPVLHVGAAFALGILMSSFYSVPAIVNFNEVMWFPPLVKAAQAHLSLLDLIAWPSVLVPDYLVQRPTYAIGWGILFATGFSLGLMGLIRKSYGLSLSLIVLSLAVTAGLLFLVPHHTAWLLLIVFCLAVAAGYGAQVIERRRHHITYAGLVIPSTLLLSIPLWYVPVPIIPVTETTPLSQVLYERSGAGYAGLPYGLPLPSNLDPAVASNNPLDTDYDASISRVQNPGFNVTQLGESAYRGEYQIDTDTAFSFRYNRAYSPHWYVQTESDAQVLIDRTPDNFIELSVPPDTETEITLRYGATPTSVVAWGLSFTAVIVSLVLWFRRWRRRTTTYDHSRLLSRRTAMLLMIVVIMTSTLRISADFLPYVLWEQMSPVQTGALTTVNTQMDDTFMLHAYEFPRGPFNPGDTIRVNTQWMVAQDTTTQYFVQLAVTDTIRRNTFFETEIVHAGYYPSPRWPPLTIVPQAYEITLPDTMQSGRYLIVFNVYTCTQQCLHVDGETLPAGQIPILRPVIIQ